MGEKMKNINLKAGLGLFLSLCCIAGCSDKAASAKKPSEDARASQEIESPISGAESEAEAAAEALARNKNVPAANRSCKSSDECTLVPAEGCFGCMKKGGQHFAVNKNGAMEIMQQREKECKPQLQNFKGPQQGDMSTDIVCQTNGAKCVSGVCQAVKLSDAEFKARQELIKKKIEEMQKRQRESGGQQGGAQGGQQGPQGGNGFQRAPQGGFGGQQGSNGFQRGPQGGY